MGPAVWPTQGRLGPSGALLTRSAVPSPRAPDGPGTGEGEGADMSDAEAVLTIMLPEDA